MAYRVVACKEGVVDTDDNVLVDSVDLLSNGLDISDSKKWVGHKLEPDHLGVWLDGSDNIIWVSNIDHGEFNAVL